MKYKKIILSAIFLIAILFFFNTKVYAGNLQLKNLDYNVTLNSDGTANVTETWDISIEDTNTLFKTFEIDKSKYSEITNVSVIEITNGINKSFSRIYSEKYHVDKNCFYALINSKKQFEIAWGVHEDDSYSRRQFKINYTIVDAVKNYNDCSEFYWQFISTSSAIPSKNVTGTITLPSNLENLQNLKVWAHGPLNGNIYIESSNSVKFEVANLNSHTMLETRVVTPNNIFNQNLNTSNTNKLDSILEQEQKWADEANKERERIANREKFIRIGLIIFYSISNIIGLFIMIILIKKIKKYKKELEIAPNYKPTMPNKYFRDIPNEKATPADAGYLYYFKTATFSTHITSIFSATLLDLCLKKYLSFEIIENNKKDINVKLNTDISTLKPLSADELEVYNFLKNVSSTNSFTMKDFEKYCKNHSTKFNTICSSIEKNAKNNQIENGNYDKNLISTSQKWSSNGVAFLVLSIFICIPFMALAIIPSIIASYYCFKIYGRYNTLTQKGVDEKESWVGLKNYMNDFSLLKEKEVPELVLWEKYLVFATAFGIADKVLSQLKVIYPELNDTNYLKNNGYSYFYLMYHHNMANNFIHSINNSVTNTYNSTNYSSGSGSGGGFSGGGGFGGGGGRNGWSLVHYSQKSSPKSTWSFWGNFLRNKNSY